MVHKATGGVPRLINQVCDHVLLLAYAASVRRIEPAHVEEAWADLQQLPTPWSEPAPTSNGAGVIEFGGLDDEPTDVSPIAGKISGDFSDFLFGENGTVSVHARSNDAVAMSGEASAAVTEATTVEDDTAEQLHHIRQLIEDVEAEFQPLAAEGPEVELVFHAPHPFTEPFEEEELIADRYATVAPPAPAPQPAAAVSATAVTKPVATSNHEELRREAELVAGDVSPFADDQSARPPRSAVPPPRAEFGRLFARMRKGL
jgi:hypothetical protein